MKIHVEITRDVLPAGGLRPVASSCGAVVEFAGVVRGEENGAVIGALDYEAYEEMARGEMERIVRELAAEFACESVAVWHRVGRVPVGEASIVVRVEAKHRAEAFGMLTELMNRLKRDVPIWKKVVT
jgi:molybdopterin synthase catalytic subunit